MRTRLPPLKCSFPSCNNTVGFHRVNKDGKGMLNKQVCEYHRHAGKPEIDRWKLDQGCANKDAHYGFACVCINIPHPATLDINHKDGNNLNRDPQNIEILCKMCHTTVTVNEKHHIPSGERKWKISKKFKDLFDEA